MTRPRRSSRWPSTRPRCPGAPRSTARAGTCPRRRSRGAAWSAGPDRASARSSPGGPRRPGRRSCRAPRRCRPARPRSARPRPEDRRAAERAAPRCAPAGPAAARSRQDRVGPERFRRLQGRHRPVSEVRDRARRPHGHVLEAGEGADERVGDPETQVILRVGADAAEGQHREHERGLGRGRAEGAGEAIPAARHRFHPGRIAVVAAQAAAQRAHGHAQVRVPDHGLRPDAGHEVRLGDHVAPGLDQDLQQGQHLRGQRHQRPFRARARPCLRRAGRNRTRTRPARSIIQAPFSFRRTGPGPRRWRPAARRRRAACTARSPYAATAIAAAPRRRAR